MLYTISEETVRIHVTDNLSYTPPFVLYGVFRHSICCIQGNGDGPADGLTRDKAMIFNVLAWAGYVTLTLTAPMG